MQLKLIIAALAICVAPSAQAQAERTYFLVDASDSMDDPSIDGSIPKTYADEILERELLKLVTPSSRANASINFFRANAKQCSAGTGKVGPQIPIPDPLPKSPKSTGATNLGATFEAALNDAAGHKARIVIITDGEQSDNCGFHVCTIAGERLPALRGVSIEQHWALAGKETTVPFQCIQDALQARDRVLSNGAAATHEDKQEENNVHGSWKDRPGSEGKTQSRDWDDAQFFERWLWLVLFMLAISSAMAFGIRWLLEALSLEDKSGRIQQHQRMVLMGEGNETENRQKIAVLSKVEEAKGRRIHVLGVQADYATLWCIFPAFLALIGSGVLIFWDGLSDARLGRHETFLGIDLDAARQMSWLVLSSDFSNAFAILAVTPLFVAGSLYLRLTQAKKNFALVTNRAAEEEARRQSSELDSLFGELEQARDRVSNTDIETTWINPPRQIAARRRSSRFTDQDREYLEMVKERLRVLAQGPSPTKVGATKELLTDRIRTLERYGPARFFRKKWDLPSLIDDLDDPAAKTFGAEATDWRNLAKAVRENDQNRIKASLKKLSAPTAEPP